MSTKPEFNKSEELTIGNQTNSTNCVVSNLFGMFETLDTLQGNTDATSKRYEVVRKALTDTYSFYQSDFFPFDKVSNMFTLSDTWEALKSHPNAHI